MTLKLLKRPFCAGEKLAQEKFPPAYGCEGHIRVLVSLKSSSYLSYLISDLNFNKFITCNSAAMVLKISLFIYDNYIAVG